MKQSKLKDSNPLYKHCVKEWHLIIDQHQSVKSVKKGGKIFSEGDAVGGIFFIINGKAKIVSAAGSKDERIHRLAGEHQILGHRGFAASEYPVSGIALTDTTLLFLPNAIFLALIKGNPSLSIYMINFLAEQLRESEQKMRDAVRLDVKQRIALVLLDLVMAFGYDPIEKTRLSFTLSRKDFASMAGTTYETVIRTLKEFQRMKLIYLSGKSIHILKIKGLRELVA